MMVRGQLEEQQTPTFSRLLLIRNANSCNTISTEQLIATNTLLQELAEIWDDYF